MYSRISVLLTKCMQLQEGRSEKEYRRQQRLFTGALFPESVNDALWHFAQRHHLTSCVWVPLKLFDVVLRKYNIYVLPTAALCDVTMTYGGNALEVAHAIGVDRIYVNAQQTSNTSFFEYFRECMTSILPTDTSSNALSLNTLNEFDNFNDNVKYLNPTSTTCTTEENVKTYASFHSNNINSKNINNNVTIDEKGNHINKGGDGVCSYKWNDYITAADPQERHHELQKLISKGEMRVFSLYNKRFCYPLTSTSAPLIDSQLVRRLLQIQEERKYKSNYWIKSNFNMKSMEMKNVEETEYAGRYNPTWSVHYYPHTYTNLSFPSHTRRLMRQRAVEYGYVSRTWITLYEAEHVFRIKLKPERAHDAPCIYCNYFSIDNSAHAFYCADQFNSGKYSFPTAQEIDLASSGVQIEVKKLAAFPLLRYIAMSCVESQVGMSTTSRLPATALESPMTNTQELIEKNAEYNKSAVSNSQEYKRTHNTNSAPGIAKVASFYANDRIGADTLMSDAVRHIRFEQLAKRYDNLRLYGYTKRKQQENHLKSGFREVLRRQCILRGFPVPFFISARQILHMGFTVRWGELGIPQTVLPLRLLDFNAWLDGECWFNVSQLEEPDVVLEMFFHPAVHFLTREKLTGSLMTRCCRQQVRRQLKSQYWLPHFILQLTGWSVKSEATAIPFKPMAFSSKYKMFRVTDNFMFNLDDVLISGAEREFLLMYKPVNEKGEKYIRVLRMAMALCALFYGYESCIWILYQVGNESPFYERRSAKAKERLHNVNKAFTKSRLFLEHPFVTYRAYKFINIEELLNFDNVLPSPTVTCEPNLKNEKVDEHSLTPENWAALFDGVQEEDEQNSSETAGTEGNLQCEERFQSSSVSAQGVEWKRKPTNYTDKIQHSTFDNKSNYTASIYDDDDEHDHHSHINNQNKGIVSQDTQMEHFDYYGQSHFTGNGITDDEMSILY